MEVQQKRLVGGLGNRMMYLQERNICLMRNIIKHAKEEVKDQKEYVGGWEQQSMIL